MSRTLHHGKHSPRWKWKMPNGYGASPGWWVNLFMTRPRRGRTRRLLRLVANDAIDVDNVTFDVGGRKPHKYYW